MVLRFGAGLTRGPLSETIDDLAGVGATQPRNRILDDLRRLMEVYADVIDRVPLAAEASYMHQ